MGVHVVTIGDIQVTVVGRDESATTVQSVPLSIHESALPVMPTQFNQPIVGDLKAKDFAPEVEGEQTRTDELGNIVTTDQPDPDREDVLYDSSGNDSISALGGDDYINAKRGGDDKLDGGTGSDIIVAFDGNDIVIGGEGADLIGGGNNDDYVFGGAEVTLTEAFAAQDAETSGEKGDLVDGNSGRDVLVGDIGNDVIHGGTDEDILLGGAGDDVMYGDAEVQNATREWTVTRSITQENGGRRYNTDYQNASVTLVAGSHDVMFGGAGSDWMFGGEGHDYLDGSNHADVLFGEAGHDTLLGGDGNDMLAGDGEGVPQEEQGDDYLDGGAGDDELIGMAGNDTLLGGADNDQLYGGDGDDFLDGGSGNDLLNGGSGNNTLNGGDGTDTLLGNVDNDIIFGGIGDDVAGGHNGDDAIYGEAGNDQLQGGTGLDLLDGGADNDVLFGEGDNDILLGGSGNDQLIGGSGHDILDGGDDIDVLYGDDGDDTLLGGAGDDYLIGGVGNDFLNGGQGNDVYYFRLGEGIDHLADDGGSYDWLVIENGTLEDVARLDVGSLAIVFNDGSELHLDDFDPDNPGSGSIEYIMFADGTVVTTQQLVDLFGFQVEGTPGEDELSGTALDDSINAYDGNDVVDGRGGDDVVNLGGGDDIALGGDGNDLVTAGAGDDMVLAGNGHDVVYGGSEADTLYGEAGNDHLYGEGGNDWLAGGSGSDILEGGAGNDSYLFTLGDGQDSIIDTAGTNQVVLGSDVTADNVSFRRQGDDLVIAISGTSDQLTVTDWFTGNDASWAVMLGDGTILNQAEVEALVGRNEAPQAQADGASLGEGTATPVTLNVLANDSDPESLPLSVINPGVYHGLYGTLTLLANGTATYQLDTAAPEVQAMADGQVYTDTFVYTVTDASPDGAQNSSATVSFTITGANDGPVAHADTGSVSEDGALTAGGNVLANDSDVDAGDHLHVAAGSYAGNYGTLVMQIDGNYQYTLNNDAAQALGRNDVVAEQFSYSVIDSAGAQSTATLTIAVQGVNDAPVLAVPLADQSATPNRDFAWQIPGGAFTDADAGDVLLYSATLADGSTLPDWLVFDAATGTFSGRVPRDASGYLDIVVTAGGVVGADDLSTSDIFRLSFEAGGGGGGGNGGGGNGDGHGNAGVGNGEDPPPPGQADDFNDGPGTGPGSPGAQGPDGNRPQPIELDDLYDDHPGVGTNHVRRGRRPHAAPGGGGETVAQANNAGNTDADSTFDDWFGTESTEPEFASAPFWIEPEPWSNEDEEGTLRNGNDSSAFHGWEQVDTQLPIHLANTAQGAALGHDGAAIGLGNGAGFLGSTTVAQNDPLSLGAVNGNRMNVFRGLSEGMAQAR